MKVVFLTIVLDGMPFVSAHYWQFQKLPFLWEWRVIEGVAAPVADTNWVRQISPRLSNDGTTQFLDSIATLDPRVILFRKSLWPGKVAMLNAALKTVDQPCLLMEIDHDEVWATEEIAKLRHLFIDNPQKNAAYFRDRYFVGPNIVITNKDGNHYGNNEAYEWHRAWRFQPGMQFERHEPPVIRGLVEVPFTHAETSQAGLVFDHFSWATEASVKAKCEYYGSENNAKGALYNGGVIGWKRLQANTKWPVEDLSAFMPWVGPGCCADRLLNWGC